MLRGIGPLQQKATLLDSSKFMQGGSSSIVGSLLGGLLLVSLKTQLENSFPCLGTPLQKGSRSAGRTAGMWGLQSYLVCRRTCCNKSYEKPPVSERSLQHTFMPQQSVAAVDVL